MSESVELLAPSGNEQNFYGAIKYGADAVYLGLSDFSARKNAGNFTLEKLKYYVSFAHIFGVKVYVAVNTVIKNQELEKYFEHISLAYACGVDAFIVQDIFLGRELKKRFPGIVLHLSTQAGINNVDGAKQAVSYGFSRVILARETDIKEIKKITKIVETEVFVHGALCTCLSGHCYFSSFIGGQSGNRGACRQPCRKLYKYEGKGVNDSLRYALSLSDLSLANRCEELISAGVKSLKIEGRMRSYEYVCASCDFYNELLKNKNLSRLKFENLKRTYNRGGYTEGLVFGQDKNLISDKIQNHAGSVVAKVNGISNGELSLSQLKHKIRVGDSFKILTNGVETGNAIAIEKNNKISVIYRQKAFIGSELAITKDVSLEEKYAGFDKKVTFNAQVLAEIGKPLQLTVNGQTYYSDYIVSPAVNSVATKGEIKENLRKTDIYPFEIIPSVVMNEKVFIPKKAMNELRSRAYKELFYSFAFINEKELKIPDNFNDFNKDYVLQNSNEKAITVISSDFSFKPFNKIKNLVFSPYDYNDDGEFEQFFKQSKKFNSFTYLYVPAFLNEADEKIIESRLLKFDGIYCEGASGLFLAKRHKKKFFGGIELNVTNNLSYGALLNDGANEICLSKELSRAEILKMNKGWTLSLGAIKVMTLIYCPFKKNCSTCNRSNNLSLRDGDNRVFKVRKYKLSTCRFEIYNESLLKSKYPFDLQIFDFTTLSNKQIDDLINAYENGATINSLSFTSGNLNKGVE